LKKVRKRWPYELKRATATTKTKVAPNKNHSHNKHRHICYITIQQECWWSDEHSILFEPHYAWQLHTVAISHFQHIFILFFMYPTLIRLMFAPKLTVIYLYLRLFIWW